MQDDSSTDTLYVSIDFGKNAHCYAAYRGERLRVVQPPQMVVGVRSGYEQLCQWLRQQILAGAQPIVVGYEPTGIYHEAWVNHLLHDFEGQLSLRQLNPFQVRVKRLQLKNGRKQKDDALDAQAIAHCLRDGLGHEAQPLQADSLRFSLWATSLRQTQHAIARTTRQVLAQIDRLWPGALLDVGAFRRAHPTLAVPEPWVRTSPLTRQQIQGMLQFAPNPYTWLAWTAHDIQAFYHSHGLRCGPQTVARIQAVLARLLPPAPDLAALLAQQLQHDFAQYQHLAQQLAAIEQHAEQLVPASPAQVLTTLPGIGPLLAAQYLAWVGDPQRFQHADQIWSLAGFDVVRDHSGDRRRVGTITKRGAGAFRHVLFTIGLKTSQHCPALADTKQKALQRGMGPIGAVIHTAHRANRICFRLLRDQVPFDPHRLR